MIVLHKKGEIPAEDVKEQAIEIAKLAASKKAKDTVILELKDLTTIAQYFIICTGENPAQIRAIVDTIEEHLSKKKIYPIGREGVEFARWVLLDYGDIVVHIFDAEARAYYDLEKFWMDAPRIFIDE